MFRLSRNQHIYKHFREHSPGFENCGIQVIDQVADKKKKKKGNPFWRRRIFGLEYTSVHPDFGNILGEKPNRQCVFFIADIEETI